MKPIAPLILILLQTAPSWAQSPVLISPRTREVVEQQSREFFRNQPVKRNQTPQKKGDKIDPSTTKQNIHGSYSVSLMGSRLKGNSNETYNVFLTDVAPVQLFHAFSLSYQVNPDFEIGVGQTGVQNLYDNVVGNTGIIHRAETTWFDPTIFFNFPNLFKIDGLSIFTSASFSLSITEASRDIGRITAIEIGQGISVNTFPSPWSYGLNWSLRPQFHTEPKPDGVYDRQVLTGSMGHFLGYRVSPLLAFNSSTTFDFEHREPDPDGTFHFGPNLDDRARLSMTLSPPLASGFFTIGGYFQFLILKPSPETSIVGADLSIGF